MQLLRIFILFTCAVAKGALYTDCACVVDVCCRCVCADVLRGMHIDGHLVG